MYSIFAHTKGKTLHNFSTKYFNYLNATNPKFKGKIERSKYTDEEAEVIASIKLCYNNTIDME